MAGDLGAQLVGRAAGGSGDVGIGLGLELGDLGLEAGPAVGEQRLGLGVGLGQQALALGLDVALGLADAGGLGVGVGLGLRPTRRARSGSRSVRAAKAFLIDGPRTSRQQPEDDQRGERRRRSARLLGPDPGAR